MDMGLVTVAAMMGQTGVQSNVQLAVFKESMNASQTNTAKLLQAMPSVDTNPAIGKHLNIVA